MKTSNIADEHKRCTKVHIKILWCCRNLESEIAKF